MRLLRLDGFAFCLLSVSVLFLSPSLAAADGGTVRLSERKGDYQITVFTSPTPLRAGPGDISVFIQNAATLEPVSAMQVTIKATRRGSPDVIIQHPATTDAATNKLYYAATFDLPEPGWYSLEVFVAGTLGDAQVRLELEAAEPLPAWRAMWPWIGWPILAILLFSIHQLQIRRRSH
jgi:hypothetical protein